MSISINEIVNGVRDYLLRPDYETLPKYAVLSRLHHKLDHYSSRLKITNRGWLVGRWNLNVDTERDEYTVSASNFGRPFSCLTKDDTDANHVEREVEIVVVQNRDLYYQGTKQGVASFVQPHVAACVSFYRDASRGWLAKITPIHSQPATYEVWYIPDRPLPPVLADNLKLVDAFVNLYTVDVALSLLPNIIKTDDKGNVTNAGQISMIERRCNADKADYLQLFNTYAQSTVVEQTGPRRGWGGEDSDTVYW